MELNHRHFHLSPDPIDGNGGNPVVEKPEFDASKYVPREDFDRVRGELDGIRPKLGEYERKFQEYDARFNPKPKNEGPVDPNAPDNIRKYDFKNDPSALQRYNLDNYKYLKHLDKLEAEKDAPKRQEAKSKQEREESIQEAEQEHESRMEEHAKTSPEFARKLQDAQRTGILQVPTQIYEEVVTSDASAEIIEYMIDNPSTSKDLRKALMQQGLGGVQRLLGRIEAKIEAEKSARQNPRNNLARDRVPNIGRPVNGGGGKQDLASLVKTYRNA